MINAMYIIYYVLIKIHNSYKWVKKKVTQYKISLNINLKLKKHRIEPIGI